MKNAGTIGEETVGDNKGVGEAEEEGGPEGLSTMKI